MPTPNSMSDPATRCADSPDASFETSYPEKMSEETSGYQSGKNEVAIPNATCQKLPESVGVLINTSTVAS